MLTGLCLHLSIVYGLLVSYLEVKTIVFLSKKVSPVVQSIDCIIALELVGQLEFDS